MEEQVDTNYHAIELIMAIQGKITVPKDKWNEFGKYHFRSAEDIWIAAKPLFAKYGMLVIGSDRVENVGKYNYQVCKLTVYNKQGYVTSAEGWAREDDGRKGMDAPQLSGSASSYACKRAWGNLLGLADESDPDATNKHEADEKPKRERTAPANHITKAQSDAIHVLLSDSGMLMLKPEYKQFLTMKGILKGESISNLNKQQASEAIRDFNAHVTQMFSNKEMHKLMLPAFKGIVKKEDKEKLLKYMESQIEEILEPVDYQAIPTGGLDGYFRLYLDTIHNQEHNRILNEGEAKGLSPADVKKQLEDLGMKPRVVKQVNIDKKEEKKEEKTSGLYEEVDDSFL